VLFRSDWDGHTGLIDEGLLRHVVERPEATSWRYIICGPQAMIERVEKALMAFGVPSQNVVSEQFYYD